MSVPTRRCLVGLVALAFSSFPVASGQILIGPPSPLPTGDAERVHLGDLDGDGHLDLFVAPDFLVFTDNSSYSVALGNGDGTFAPASVTGSQSSYWGRGELVDLDGDGHLDFVVPADAEFLDPHVRVFHGAGDGTFSAGQIVGSHLFSGSVCKVRDLDGDGDQDIVEALSGFGGATLQVYLADDLSPGTFDALTTILVGGPTLFEYVSDFEVADLDGDGFPEIVAVSYDGITPTNGTLAVLHGTGPATWAPQVTSTLPGPPHAMKLADLDGNGDLDVVTRFGTGGVLVLPGHGDGTFGPGTVTPAGSAVPPSTSLYLAVGDLDGDGTQDVIAPTGLSTTVLRGLGDGTFTPLVVSHTYAANGVALGDLDEDGDLDLAVAGSQECGGGDCPGRVFLLRNETYQAGSPFTDLGQPLAGGDGYPIHIASGTLDPHTPFLFDACNGPPSALAYLVVGLSELSAPFKGGVMVPEPDVVAVFVTNADGEAAAIGLWPVGLPTGTSLWMQWWFDDAGGVAGKSATSALRAVTP